MGIPLIKKQSSPIRKATTLSMFLVGKSAPPQTKQVVSAEEQIQPKLYIEQVPVAH